MQRLCPWQSLALFLLVALSSNCQSASGARNNRPGEGEFSNAKRVAANRAINSEDPTNCYHEPLAKVLAGDEAIEQVRALLESTGQSTARRRNQVTTVTARQMLINQFLYEALTSGPHAPRQVVILGAGLDTRPYQFHHFSAKWFEIDLPEVVSYKERTLGKHPGFGSLPPVNVKRIRANLLEDKNWLETLEAKGWDPAAPTVFILEGLLYYFPIEDVQSILQSIPSVPASHVILTMIELSLQKIYESYGMTKGIWKSNLEDLRRAGLFQKSAEKNPVLPHYRFVRKAFSAKPEASGLPVHVGKSPTRNFLERIQFFVHRPSECVLEFQAV